MLHHFTTARGWRKVCSWRNRKVKSIESADYVPRRPRIQWVNQGWLGKCAVSVTHECTHIPYFWYLLVLSHGTALNAIKTLKLWWSTSRSVGLFPVLFQPFRSPPPMFSMDISCGFYLNLVAEVWFAYPKDPASWGELQSDYDSDSTMNVHEKVHMTI